MAQKRDDVTDAGAGIGGRANLEAPQFGDGHTSDLGLEWGSESPLSGAENVEHSFAGFGETEILDETARIGDWHRRELKFDPGGTSTLESESE